MGRQERARRLLVHDLDRRVVEIVLRVRVLQLLAPRDLGRLPAPARDLRVDADAPRRRHRHVHVTVRADAARRARHRERLGVVFGDFARRRLPGRIRDDLQQPGYEPVLVDRVVVFGGDNVK